jgi:hypothetical protein
LSDSFVKHLTALGLKRQAKQVPTLQQYLASSEFNEDRQEGSNGSG